MQGECESVTSEKQTSWKIIIDLNLEMYQEILEGYEYQGICLCAKNHLWNLLKFPGAPSEINMYQVILVVPNKCTNCDQNNSFKGTLKNILNHFRGTRYYKRYSLWPQMLCKNILNQLMITMHKLHSLWSQLFSKRCYENTYWTSSWQQYTT